MISLGNGLAFEVNTPTEPTEPKIGRDIEKDPWGRISGGTEPTEPKIEIDIERIISVGEMV